MGRSLRTLWIGFGAVMVVSTANLQQSDAREPLPYCLQGGRGSTGGMLQCSYFTWEQCLAAISGGDESCSRNPELGWRAIEAQRMRGFVPSSQRPRPRGH
jgi:hypothetical protein